MYKNGVSLVALIITIIVIIIITTTVILNISDSGNHIDKAEESNILNEIGIFRDELNMNLAQNPRMELSTFEILFETKNRYDLINQYIPSVKKAEDVSIIPYEKVLVVYKGELMLYDKDNLLSEEQKKAILKRIDNYEKYITK